MATVKEMKELLDAAGVEYDSKAKAAELEELVAGLGTDEDDSDSEEGAEDEGSEDGEDSEEKDEPKDERSEARKDSEEQSALRKELEAGEQITIRLPKVKGAIPTETVTINGTKFFVPRGKQVTVPAEVGRILMAKLEAQENAGSDSKLDGDEKELA